MGYILDYFRNMTTGAILKELAAVTLCLLAVALFFVELVWLAVVADIPI